MSLSRYPRPEIEKILSLHGQQFNKLQIAQTMKTLYPDNWSHKTAANTVAKIIQEFGDSVAKPESFVDTAKTLDEMTREERFKYIQEKLQSTPRFKMTFQNFSDKEKSVFIDEYLAIVKSVDSLTEPEEQSLFASVLELVLALQALNRKQLEEKLYIESMEGRITEDNPRFRRQMDDKYHKEYNNHMNLYQKGMESMKMSRQQRLNKVQTERLTLVDLAEQLSSKSAQADAAEQIEKLSKLKDEQLKIMIDNGHIFGYFGD